MSAMTRWACGAAALLILTPLVQAKDLPYDQLPQEIRAALKADFPNGKFVSANTEGKDEIEVHLSFKNSEKLDVLFKVKPRYDLVDEEITVKNLPVDVVNAVEKRFPGAKIDEAESVLNLRKQVVAYTLEITHKGKQFEVFLTPKGAFLSEP